MLIAKIENEDAREFDLCDVERLVRHFQAAKQICRRSRNSTTEGPFAVAVAGLTRVGRNTVRGDLQVMSIDEVIAEMKSLASDGTARGVLGGL